MLRNILGKYCPYCPASLWQNYNLELRTIVQQSALSCCRIELLQMPLTDYIMQWEALGFRPQYIS